MKPSDLTSWRVIEQAASGVSEAREDFVRRYEPVVRAYFGSRWRSSSRPEDVDDVVQEVFLECFRDGGALARVERDRPGGFRAFLYGVVRHVALRFERHRARSRERQAGPHFNFDDVGRDEASLSRVFDRAWARLMVRDAFRAQAREAETIDPRAVRRVELLRARFQDDLPIREIARMWGVDAKTLHREYERAQSEFHAALIEVVALHSPGSRGHIERECHELLSLLG